jgi:hypothetical protein
MVGAYKQPESTTLELKGASVEWPWFQKKTERISISIPVLQARDFVQPKYTVVIEVRKTVRKLTECRAGEAEKKYSGRNL